MESVELLCACDLVLMSVTIKGLRNKFMKWKEAFESKDLKITIGESELMVSGGITKDGFSMSTVHPCGVCSMREKANSLLCVQCGKWTFGRCADV